MAEVFIAAPSNQLYLLYQYNIELFSWESTIFRAAVHSEGIMTPVTQPETYTYVTYRYFHKQQQQMCDG